MVTNKGYKTVTIKETTWKQLAACGTLDSTYDSTIQSLIKSARKESKA